MQKQDNSITYSLKLGEDDLSQRADNASYAPDYQQQQDPNLTAAINKQIEREDIKADLILDQLRADINTRLSTAEKEQSIAFTNNGTVILNGMNELRLALNYAMIDSEKERSSSGSDRPPLKELFETAERQQIKKRYAELMDLFVDFVKPIRPKKED